MRSLLQFFSKKRLLHLSRNLTHRFSLATTIVVCITVILLSIVATENAESIHFRTIVSLIVTGLLSIGATLFAESKNLNIHSIQLIPIIYGIIFFFFFVTGNTWHYDTIVITLLHIIGFFVWIFVSPYLSKKSHTPEYLNYLIYMRNVFLMSVSTGMFLWILGSIAIASITFLFQIDSIILGYKLFGYWSVLSGALCAPIYWIAHIPDANSISKKDYETDPFSTFLTRIIFVPFIYVYFIILYAYSIKVLLNFGSWPKSIISWLVIAFSLFGYIGYIFSKSYEKNHNFIRIFRTYFPIVVMPQIAMLGYAIYLRIAQYDLSINRYLVVIFGCWLLLVSLYYTLSRQKNLIVLPASLTIIAIVFSFGPWSVTMLPLNRQEARLMDYLEKSNMIGKDGKIVSAPSDIEPHISSEIYSIINYLCKFDDCNRIKEIFSDHLSDTHENKSTWEITSEITKNIDVSKMDFVSPVPHIRLYRSSPSRAGIFPIKVDGYDYLYEIKDKEIGDDATNFALFNQNNLSISVPIDERIHTFSLEEYTKRLQKIYTNNYQGVNNNDLEILFESESYQVKVLFVVYEFENKEYPGSDPIKHSQARGYVLVSNKYNK